MNNRLIIKIKTCEPDLKAPNVKDLDEIEWVNEDSVDHQIQFTKLPAPIFKGHGTHPDLKLPAKGCIEVRVLEKAPPGKHEYFVSGGNCADGIDPGAIVVDS